MEYRRAIINTPTRAPQNKSSIARIIAAAVVASLVGVALIYIRVSSRFHWADLFEVPVLIHLLWVELVFFIWVACRIAKRIARGPGRAKWGVPFAAAVILLAAEVTLYFKAIVPERARKAQESRQRFRY